MEDDPKSVLAHKVVSHYAAAFHPAPKPMLYGVQFFPVSQFIHPSLTVKIMRILFVLISFSLIVQEYVSQ